MQKIVTNLWFNGRVEEALDFYGSVFPDLKIKSIMRYTEAGPGNPGDVMVANFQITGQDFTIINGGPEFPHTPAMSLLINCKDQAEVDHFWEKLVEGGGQHQECGWLSDRFGVNWQVVPVMWDSMLENADEAQTDRVMRAMLSMKKLDIAALEQAYRGE